MVEAACRTYCVLKQAWQPAGTVGVFAAPVVGAMNSGVRGFALGCVAGMRRFLTVSDGAAVTGRAVQQTWLSSHQQRHLLRNLSVAQLSGLLLLCHSSLAKVVAVVLRVSTFCTHCECYFWLV